MTEAPKRRSFNKLVNNPVLEDYALRYAPKSFRTWSEHAVATTALGGIAYMADQAIGGSLAVQFSFSNAFFGILAAALVTFLTGMTLLAKLQVWTQPLWLLMLFAPPIAVLVADPHAISQWTNFTGTSSSGAKFDWITYLSLSVIA